MATRIVSTVRRELSKNEQKLQTHKWTLILNSTWKTKALSCEWKQEVHAHSPIITKREMEELRYDWLLLMLTEVLADRAVIHLIEKLKQTYFRARNYKTLNSQFTSSSSTLSRCYITNVNMLRNQGQLRNLVGTFPESSSTPNAIATVEKKMFLSANDTHTASTHFENKACYVLI